MKCKNGLVTGVLIWIALAGCAAQTQPGTTPPSPTYYVVERSQAQCLRDRGKLPDGLQPAKGAEGDETPSREQPCLESLFALYQPYLMDLSAYEPMYFLVGTNREQSKFQISFRYQFINPDGALAQRLPWVTGFHLGYTQTSFWNLKSGSKPFEDSSYKPELFFVSRDIDTGVPWARTFCKTGFQHESNGRGGELSRSTNYLYLKPMFVSYRKESQLGLLVSPSVWVYVANNDETNRDLKDYRGYFDLELKFGKADSLVLGSHLWWAKEGGSLQMDLTYPLHRLFLHDLDLYFQVEYVDALAESLRTFRDRTRALRLGFALVR